ncbi:MAG: hypothetical protein FJZ00_00085 [Candidatus Sericytochromatia bacterium]|uniref:SMP-30/Gluconolactonase/LRE-like region domain-containing protein n=1 Tax=Candidatus Tanganyikabacteria bacterium TaxID=2961651 RepID=A0A937X060_9BACT|nr:hypothetical protein [Candidatus Tanganyikabacteria bacterium]
MVAEQVVVRASGAHSATASLAIKAETGLLLRVRAFGSATPNVASESVLAEATASVDLVRSRITSAKVNLRVKLLGYVTTLFGSKVSARDGSLNSALFSGPSGVARDAAGNLYVAESYRVRKIDTQGNVTTLAGDGRRDIVDGFGASAYVIPNAMVFDPSSGRLFVAVRGTIRVIE